MKQRTAYSLIAFLAGAAAVFAGIELAHAGGNTHDDVDVDQAQQQGQQTTVNIGGGEGAGALSETSTTMNSDDDVTITENNSVENNSSNVVLVPNNNTESCLRVVGIAWGKNGESGALGWPFRSKKCDYEGNADDAFAQGNLELGWWWKCQSSNNYDPFVERRKGIPRRVENDEAKTACFAMAVGESRLQDTIDQLRLTVDFYSAENDRLNGVLVKERQACKEQKDETYERCIEHLRK